MRESAHPARPAPCSRRRCAIPAAIVEVVGSFVTGGDVSKNERKEMVLETSYASLDRSAIVDGQPSGASSAVSCPGAGQAELIRTGPLEPDGEEEG